MAFFKFRKNSDGHSAPPAASESTEALRRRARYRLVGASMLVLAGVVGFPWLFDNQPRPVAVDIPIVIPDKPPVPASTANAGAKPPAPAASEAHTKPFDATAAAPQAAASAQKAEDVVAPATPAVKAQSKPESKPAEKAPEPPAQNAATSTASAADAAKAQALLEGRSVDTAAASDSGRFVVQFGAFTDAAKAQETRMKVERAGLKTYAQAVQTPEGKKIRVRVGPFAHKAEAEKAAQKIKKLDLPAAILEL